MRNLTLGIWVLILLGKAKLTAVKLCVLLTSKISLGVMLRKLALAVVGCEKLCMS